MNDKFNNYRPYIYLFTTLILTWLFWFGAAATGQGWLQFPNIILTILGFITPTVVAITMVKFGYWPGDIQAFLDNCFNPFNIKIKWYLVMAAALLILTGGPLLIGSIIFGQSIHQLASFSPPTVFILVGLMAGVIEEPGWRGYGQKALQQYYTPLKSSLIIGLFWALWHLPLFLIAGTYQSTIGLFSTGFIFFNLGILVGSIFYSWLYNITGQFAVIAVLYHGLGNMLRELLSFSESSFQVHLIEFSIEAFISLAVIILAWDYLTKKHN